MPDFIQECWHTPVSDAQSLAMVSLLDQNGLHMTLEDLQDPARRRFKFVFRRIAAYRNLLEEYRMSESSPPHGTGWPVTVSDSPWLAELWTEEPLLDVHSAGCLHYVIVRYRRRRNRYPVSETIGDRGGCTSEGGRKSTWQVTNTLPFL
jgi:hypothetical protein